MDPVVYLVIVVVCILLSAFFSSSETALLRLSKDQIENDLGKSNQLSVIAAKELIKTPAKLLVTILLGNNVVNILGAACASALGAFYFGEKEGLLISTVVMTMIVLVFAEILPKSVAAKNPRKVAYFCALPLYLVHKLAYPTHIFYKHVIEPLVKKIAGGNQVDQAAVVSVAESIMKMAGDLDVRKNDGTPIPIIGSAVKAAGLNCRDIMILKNEIFAFPVSMNTKDAEVELANSRFTRALIYKESKDKIIGFIHLKDLVRINNVTPQKTLKSIVKPTLMVPGKMSILTLLPKMQKAFIHIAVVTDALGHTEGVVAQEDILEEIVGEIRDEFDREELKRIRRKSPGRFEVLGNVSVHDFNKETGLELQGEPGDSVCDILYNELGHIPHTGDRSQIGNLDFKVKDISGKRVTRIEVTKIT